MGAEAETTTRTEMRSVDVEYAVCPNCGQEWDPDEYVKWLAEPETTGDGDIEAPHATELCPACSDAVMGWTDTPDALHREAAYIIREYPDRATFAAVGATLAGALGLLIGGLAGGLVGFVAADPLVFARAWMDVTFALLDTSPVLLMAATAAAWIVISALFNNIEPPD